MCLISLSAAVRLPELTGSSVTVVIRALASWRGCAVLIAFGSSKGLKMPGNPCQFMQVVFLVVRVGLSFSFLMVSTTRRLSSRAVEVSRLSEGCGSGAAHAQVCGRAGRPRRILWGCAIVLFGDSVTLDQSCWFASAVQGLRHSQLWQIGL